MDTLLNDVRYATRMAWKNRIVTLVAVASLAAGIGANSAVFSLVNAILLILRAVALSLVACNALPYELRVWIRG